MAKDDITVADDVTVGDGERILNKLQWQFDN